MTFFFIFFPPPPFFFFFQAEDGIRDKLVTGVQTCALPISSGGFTLVEIMIVVAIIALLAAIAIPNLLRARHNANETAAIGAMHSFVASMESYRAAQTPPSYPADLTDLSDADPPYSPASLTDGTNPG